MLVVHFIISECQCQHQITIPQQYDLTTNIIQPISASQPFNQFGFIPQAPYGTSSLPIVQAATINQRQTFNKDPTNRPPIISTNIPVGASYQITEQTLASSGAHAYPVQHSVEINHGDYDSYPNIFVQRVKADPQKQDIPPITRPQYSIPIMPQQSFNSYNIPNGNKNYNYPAPIISQPLNNKQSLNHQRRIRPQVPFQSYTNPNGLIKTQQPFKPYIAPSINQQVNIRRPYVSNENSIPQVVQNPYQSTQLSTPSNLPYNFKTVPAIVNPYQTSPQKTSAKLSTVNNPTPLIPKPLPSPLKSLSASHVPVPIPISGKPEVKEPDSTRSRVQEEAKPVEEEEESEEDDGSEEEDEDDEEEGTYERDYRPRYSHNYHEDTEFDRKRYRPTFDAAKYIFNEDDEAEGESEGDDRSREEHPPRVQNKDSGEKQPRRKHNERYNESESRHAQEGQKPHHKRVSTSESQEEEGRGSRLVPVRGNHQRKKYTGYYER